MAEPWEVPAARIQGCPVVGDLVVNVELWIPGVIGRSYGEDLYGSEVYGDVDGAAGWTDISDRVYGVEIIRGAADGTPIVPVHQAVVNVHDDPDDPVFEMDPRTEWPLVGAVVRVSLSMPGDPDPLPQFVGRIESVYDDHSAGAVRNVAVQAFGMVADLAVNLPSFGPRNAESYDARLDALVTAADWWWDPTRVGSFATQLAATDAEPYENLPARQLIDTAAMSAGLMFDTNPAGQVRTREWPMSLQPTGTPLAVTDCKGRTELASPSIAYVADGGELLNYATVANEDGLTSTVMNAASIERFGRRTNGVGFPLTGLHAANQAALDALAQAAADAYDYAVVRVESFEADSSVDSRWIPEFTSLDTGREVTVVRTGILPAVSIVGRICGYTLRLVRGRATATVELTTVTATEYDPTSFYLTNGAEQLTNGTEVLTNG